MATSDRRPVSRLLHRWPAVRLTLLLATPLAWLLLVYVVALAALLVTAFWSTDSLSGEISPFRAPSITVQPGSFRCAQSLNLQRPRNGRNSRIASPIWSSVRWKRPKDWKPGVSMIAVSRSSR